MYVFQLISSGVAMAKMDAFYCKKGVLFV